MILIVGAGLSGLLIAYRLKEAGIPFKLLEARNRIGGRINTVLGSNDTPVEMGATWFNDHHLHLKALLEELKIDFFEQLMDSKVFYQPSTVAPAQTVEIPPQAASFRISGGSSNLINRLFDNLNEGDVLLNQSVSGVRIHEKSVHVIANETVEGSRVVLAIPPKLWSKKISFEPQLPKSLLEVAQQTHTWMEDSIKIALTYAQPFWEDENIPATLFSNVGPITEFYDHSNHERSKFALCGFMHASFKSLPDSERKAKVIDQITTIFGVKAAGFIDYEECVWSKEEHTFEESDFVLNPHQNNGNPIFRESYFDYRLLISSSESATEFAGYMDGAVLSANVISDKIINQFQRDELFLERI